MNDPTLSSSALEILAIVDSNETFQWMMRKQPTLRGYLIEAADAAHSTPYHARLLELLTIVTSACDKGVDADLRGDIPECTRWTCIGNQASEELGRLLRFLCPWVTPFESNAIDAPS